jgi:hypothetical protein
MEWTASTLDPVIQVQHAGTPTSTADPAICYHFLILPFLTILGGIRLIEIHICTPTLRWFEWHHLDTHHSGICHLYGEHARPLHLLHLSSLHNARSVNIPATDMPTRTRKGSGEEKAKQPEQPSHPRTDWTTVWCRQLGDPLLVWSNSTGELPS